MKAKTVKEVLIAARWILDNVGWSQRFFSITKHGTPLGLGEVHPDIEAACSLGAIYLVDTIDLRLNRGATQAVEAVIGNGIDRVIHDWNDTKGRTKEEVLAAFDKAIQGIK